MDRSCVDRDRRAGAAIRVDRHPSPRFLRPGRLALGGLVAMVLAVPGLAYVLSPLRRKGQEAAFHTLTRLNELEVGVPRSVRDHRGAARTPGSSIRASRSDRSG